MHVIEGVGLATSTAVVRFWNEVVIKKCISKLKGWVKSCLVGFLFCFGLGFDFALFSGQF